MESRSDILFLYDATMTNPNGDPLDDNKPRIVGDQEIVTDVRLKRTIRDFIIRNQERDDFLIKRHAKVWLVDEKDKDGNQKTKDKLLEEKKDYWNYTDIRLFGATILSQKNEKENIVLTGPVQFRIGVSLNKVNPIFIKGTTVSPSAEGKEQGTFTERWVVEYALISFYGVFNPNISKENASLKKELEVKKEDLETLYYSMWNGTKDLVSQSKVGQAPRLLLVINYKENEFQIGPLDEYIQLENRNCKSINDVVLDISKLIDVIKANENKIDRIYIAVDNNLKIKGVEKREDLIKLIPKSSFFDKEYKF